MTVVPVCKEAPSTALLFTPGPITTSQCVKEAMMVDLGSRDPQFLKVVSSIRRRLVQSACNQADVIDYGCVLIQGSGTAAVESVLGSCMPDHGKILIMSNGCYGHRMKQICDILKINSKYLEKADFEQILVEDLERSLDETITHVAVVHHETTAGVINPIECLGEYLRLHAPSVRLIVDSMSAFGAYEIDMKKMNISFLISSSNKNLEGVPGFAFVICDIGCIKGCEGQAKSLFLDLYAQWRGLEGNGQFRFTPPTHALLAFNQALGEWEAEGCFSGRAHRYYENYVTVLKSMTEMGFELYIKDEKSRGFIITTFIEPVWEPSWDFNVFYCKLADKGFVIYPGKLAKQPSFRLGTIGRIFPRDCEKLMQAIHETLLELNIEVPLKRRNFDNILL